MGGWGGAVGEGMERVGGGIVGEEGGVEMEMQLYWGNGFRKRKRIVVGWRREWDEHGRRYLTF